MKTAYEWDIEEVKDIGGPAEDEEIVDHHHEDKLAGFSAASLVLALAGKGYRLVLVRDVWREDGELVDRQWAYATGGKLPEAFSTSGGQEDARVPKRFVAELAKFCGKTTSQQIVVRACSIICNTNPEWGTWGVYEDRGTYFEIHGRSGGRVLDKAEADKFWSVVPAKGGAR